MIYTVVILILHLLVITQIKDIMTFATMTTRDSLRAPKSMLLRVFQIFITFVHILCFSGIVSSRLRAQWGPQLTSALGPGLYWIIIIGHNSTDSIFNRPTDRRRVDDIVAAKRLAMLLCSRVRRQPVLELQAWRELFHDSVKQPKRKT